MEHLKRLELLELMKKNGLPSTVKPKAQPTEYQLVGHTNAKSVRFYHAD